MIAIGASADGVSALYDFFDNTLPDAVSYVITTHLDPRYKSVLTTIYQKHAAIEALEVEYETLIAGQSVCDAG